MTDYSIMKAVIDKYDAPAPKATKSKVAKGYYQLKENAESAYYEFDAVLELLLNLRNEIMTISDSAYAIDIEDARAYTEEAYKMLRQATDIIEDARGKMGDAVGVLMDEYEDYSEYHQRGLS